MSQGTIIFLNGTTSAGKTSTARMLQTIMAEPYLEAGIDTFLWMLPGGILKNHYGTRYWEKPANPGRWDTS